MAVSLDEKSPITWWFMLLLSTVMCAYFLNSIPETIQIQQVMQHGQLVKVEIIKTKEIHSGRKDFYYLDFRHGKTEKSIRINHNFFNQIRLERDTRLRHLSQYSDLYLPPNYDTKGESISYVMLTCFFVFMTPFCIYKIYRLRETNS